MGAQQDLDIEAVESRKLPAGEGRASVWVLVAANLVPIAGVAFWGWQVQDIVFLYWLENVVVGVLNVPRILLAEPAPGAPPVPFAMAGKIFTAVFFAFHYGFFCAGHGIFLIGMFQGFEHTEDLPGAVASLLGERGMLLALAAIVVSRGFSFLHNYLGRREYQGAEVKDLMTRPYKRIIVTHLFIIVGGLLLQGLKLPLAALVLFIGLKIAMDAHFHRRERKALALGSPSAIVNNRP